MDGRVPQPSDRRVVSRAENRQEPVYRQPEEQPVSSYPQAPAPRSRGAGRRKSYSDEPSKKGLIWILSAIAVVVVLALVGWIVFSSMKKTASDIDSSKYQAVFFTNGQVYFGKLQDFNEKYMKMTDIYYLQSETETDSKNPQNTSNNSNVKLIKLGDEIHGPEDSMVLSRDQVLFYENLKGDSKVVQSITQHKQNNKQ